MDEILISFSNYLIREKRFSSHTCRAYVRDVSVFLEFLSKEEEIVFSEINYSFIRSWIVFLSDNKYSALTINRKVSSLKIFFKYLCQNKIIEVYPLLGHRSLRVEKKIQVPFSEKEMELVFDGLAEDDYESLLLKLVVYLFYTLGVRRSELINLRLVDVDLSMKTIKVLGKRNKERLVPIVGEVELVLSKYINLRNLFFNEEEVLILSKNGNKLSETFVYRLINDYFRGVTSKSKKSPHMLRHTFATHMLNNGADLNSIKELLGHSSLSSTQIYTQTSLSELKKVYKSAHPRFGNEEL